ncbi:MAG: SiaB family protein kinase [Synergistaceae bacterium]|nr:SiaB family protein kinase [Synergistaceae bacterium]
MFLDMLEYHKMLKNKNITLIYSGPLWAEGIGGIGGTLKRRMEFDELPLETSQKVFSVFVEQMNNMLMYSAEKGQFELPGENGDESAIGTFILGKEGKTYFIQTGNLMKNENVEGVKTKLDYLNTLDKAELRKYYKEQMRSDNDNPESKGAGLGFIEIARRISSKIEYSFTPYDEGRTFFTVYVTIGDED